MIPDELLYVAGTLIGIILPAALGLLIALKSEQETW